MSIELELCSNRVWLRENAGLEFDVPEGFEDGVIDTFCGELTRRLSNAGFVVIPPQGSRSLYHHWNGTQWQHGFGAVGTFDALADDQVSTIDSIVRTAQAVANRWLWLVHSR